MSRYDDKEFTFTIFTSKRDQHGVPNRASWREWIKEAFTNFAVRGTPALINGSKKQADELKDGPCVVLGEIDEGRTHSKENVKAAHAIALDLDDRTDTEVSSVLDALDPFHYVAYSTFKNGMALCRGRARLRFVVPFDKPVAPKDYPQAWQRFNALVHNLNDPSTKDISRLHFTPATFDKNWSWRDTHEGQQYMSVEDLPIVAAGSAATAEAFSLSDDETDLDAEEALRKTRQRILHTNKNVLAPELFAALKALTLGDSLAEAGSRHDVIRKITWWLSEKNTLNDAALEQLFGKSIDVMQGEDPSWDGMQEVFKLYSDALTKRETDRSEVKISGDGGVPYTREELEHIAATQKCSVDDLQQRWIVQSASSYFFLQKSGYYTASANREAAQNMIHQELKKAPITLTVPTQNASRDRTLAELMRHYGYVVSKVQVDLKEDGTWLDMNAQLLHEATCPKRVSVDQAEFDPDIDKWLKLLSGDQYENFMKWLAVFPDLEQQNIGLYLEGKSSAGKGLLAEGLARIWTNAGPTPLEAVFGAFNSQIAQSPLIFADEGVSHYKEDPTVKIRRMLGTVRHELKRKYRDSTTVHGACRLILAANNPELLRAGQTTKEDHDAIVTKFMVINAKQGAVEFLKKLGGFKFLEKEWVQGDRIAKHVMCLHKELGHLVEGNRYAVEVKETAQSRRLFTSRWAERVIEFLVNYCTNPAHSDSHPHSQHLFRVRGGEFLVSAGGVVQMWKTYMPDSKVEPSGSDIGKALGVLSSDNPRTQRRIENGDRVGFYKIDIRYLIEYSADHGYGSEQAILRVLNRPAKKEDKEGAA